MFQSLNSSIDLGKQKIRNRSDVNQLYFDQEVPQEPTVFPLSTRAKTKTDQHSLKNISNKQIDLSNKQLNYFSMKSKLKIIETEKPIF